MFFVLLSKFTLILSYILFDIQFAAREDQINEQVSFNNTEPYYLQELYGTFLSTLQLWLLGFYIICVCITIVSTNVTQFLRTRSEKAENRYLQNSILYGRNKNLVANYMNYNFLTIFVHVTLLVDISLRLLQLHFGFRVSLLLGTTLQLVSLTLFGTTVLRYLIFIPGLGQFTLTLERASTACLTQLWIIYIITAIPYTLIFTRLTNLG